MIFFNLVAFPDVVRGHNGFRYHIHIANVALNIARNDFRRVISKIVRIFTHVVGRWAVFRISLIVILSVLSATDWHRAAIKVPTL